MPKRIHVEHSPLDEVVCGVQFAGVEWAEIHFGLFYAALQGRYEHTTRHPALPPSMFDPDISLERPQILFSPEPESPRLWYQSGHSPFLLQVQKDAFFVNWRHQPADERFTYPHFHTREGRDQGVWDRFVDEWSLFSSFCTQQNIGTPEVLACHLAYINHMVHGETWQAPADLAQLFRPLAGLRGSESMTIFNMAVRYQASDFTVRLNFRPAIRIPDNKKLFVIEFIVNGKLDTGHALEAWFDAAHTVIVQTFLDQATQDAYARWGVTYE